MLGFWGAADLTFLVTSDGAPGSWVLRGCDNSRALGKPPVRHRHPGLTSKSLFCLIGVLFSLLSSLHEISFSFLPFPFSLHVSLGLRSVWRCSVDSTCPWEEVNLESPMTPSQAPPRGLSLSCFTKHSA